MIAAFASGLIVGTVAGMSSWLVAAAYLETCRMRGVAAHAARTDMAVMTSAPEQADEAFQRRSPMRPAVAIAGASSTIFRSSGRNSVRPTLASSLGRTTASHRYPEL
jgi:hypothetical protein